MCTTLEMISWVRVSMYNTRGWISDCLLSLQTVCVSSPGTGIPQGILARDRDTERSGSPCDMYWRNVVSKLSGKITTITLNINVSQRLRPHSDMLRICCGCVPASADIYGFLWSLAVDHGRNKFLTCWKTKTAEAWLLIAEHHSHVYGHGTDILRIIPD